MSGARSGARNTRAAKGNKGEDCEGCGMGDRAGRCVGTEAGYWRAVMVARDGVSGGEVSGWMGGDKPILGRSASPDFVEAMGCAFA